MSLSAVTHQTAALARLAQFLRDKPNFAGVLASLTGRAQELETALQQLLGERDLDTAAGAQLGVLGRLVGQQRGGATDDEYRIQIRARIRVNASSGTVPEILEIFGLLWDVDLDGELRVRDEPPAAFTLIFPASEDMTLSRARVFVGLLRSIRLAGVRGLMEFGIAPPGDTFTLDGTVDQALDIGLFKGTLL